MDMTNQEILEVMKKDIASGKVVTKAGPGYRYYVDTLTGSIEVPITSNAETIQLYKKVMIDGAASIATITDFDKLPRVSMFVGQPDTGKTYEAAEIAKRFGIKPTFIMCRDSLNLETLLEDFMLVNGLPQFSPSLAVQQMSGTAPAIIILDEFNTLLTGVMKTFQPIFDNTSKTFEYRGHSYTKNLNCKFIVTLNDKDKGISIVPDAILSRSHVRWFEPVNPVQLAQWTGQSLNWIQAIQKLYMTMGLTNIFGTRQISILSNLDTTAEVINHFKGLCRMRGIDTEVLTTLPFQNSVAKLGTL